VSLHVVPKRRNVPAVVPRTRERVIKLVAIMKRIIPFETPLRNNTLGKRERERERERKFWGMAIRVTNNHAGNSQRIFLTTRCCASN